MKTVGLSLDQAPPLSIPLRFFLIAPLAIMAAGLLILTEGNGIFVTHWLPRTIALAHLGTLGLLAMVMLGALYQMVPVVAGAAVPKVQWAKWVYAFMGLGILSLVLGLISGPPWLVPSGTHTLGLGLAIFLGQVGWGLAKAPTKSETVHGMRLACLALAVVASLGIYMALGFEGRGFPQQRALWLQTHLSLALLIWVGGLIMAVSWQVIPMFYLAPHPASLSMRLSLLGLVMSLILLPLVLLTYSSADAAGFWPLDRLAILAAAPAAIVVWIVHPIATLRQIAKRLRKRSDASLWFWRAGLGNALLLVPVALLAHLEDGSRATMLFGWLAIWGWAGMILHGMLTRILPFLIWFHRYSSLVGKTHVPSMRSLWTQKRIKLGFALHLISLILGAFSILSGAEYPTLLTGLTLIATGVVLGASLLHTSAHRPDLSA
jgi:uncharacterized protein YhhL (DUF1145 family)